MVGFVLLFISLGVLIRYSLVIVGMLKGPVLETFERYGDDDPVYFPWPQILFWVGVMIIGIGQIAATETGTLSTPNLMAVACWVIGWVLFSMSDSISHETALIPHIPLWLDKLAENTGRYERRRIAYMWLKLPMRTRLLYNASDRLFFQWAELVIMATVRES